VLCFSQKNNFYVNKKNAFFNLHFLLHSEGQKITQEETEWWLKIGFEAVLKEVTSFLLCVSQPSSEP